MTIGFCGLSGCGIRFCFYPSPYHIFYDTANLRFTYPLCQYLSFLPSERWIILLLLQTAICLHLECDVMLLNGIETTATGTVNAGTSTTLTCPVGKKFLIDGQYVDTTMTTCVSDGVWSSTMACQWGM